MTKQTILARNISLIVGVLLAINLAGLSVFGQSSASTVNGTVTDQQRNVVAGATVTLSNPAKNFVRTQTTNESGRFNFTLIPPGNYQISVGAKGFKRAVLADVNALVDKPTEVMVGLEVGNVTESVTVSAASGEVLLNTQDATLGNNFVNKQITQLPLEAKNVTALLTLQPGVTSNGYVAGARSDQSNVTLDGVDINEAQTNQIGQPSGGAPSDATDTGGTATTPDQNTVIRLNAEAIEEFRVTTVNANATQGRSAGAQISLITKSGTNTWHGSLFESHRNTITSANDFFNNRSGIARPKLIRNVYGGSVGGPIIKDRFFFFYSYEGRRDASQQTVVQVVPRASMGQGQLRYLGCDPSVSVDDCGVSVTPHLVTMSTAQLNAIFPAVGMNPVAIAALAQAAAKYPVNDTTVGDGLNTGGFRFNASTPVKLNSHSARFDYNLNSKQQLFVRTNVIYDLIGAAPQFPDTPTPNTWSHPIGFVAGHTWTIGSNKVNTFRYGYTRESFTVGGDSAANAISFRFVFSPLAYTRTFSRKTPVQNITDDYSWVRGNHTLQIGTNIRLISNNRVSFSNAYDSAITNPSFYAGGAGTILSDTVSTQFAPIAGGGESAVQNAVTALIGRFSQYTARFTFDHGGSLQPAGSPTARTFKTQAYDGYFQDIWKMTPNLTLTAGLRYTLSRPVYEVNGFEVKPDIPLGTYFERRLAGAASGNPYIEPITVDLSGPANNRTPLYHWDKNNFQPRVAVAWSPGFKSGLLSKLFGANHESVIRGGFGISNDYYGQQIAVSFDLNNQLGFSSQTTISANTFNVSSRPAPLFTSFTQDVRSLPRITLPGMLVFPQRKSPNDARRIEQSLDENLVAPTEYSWNLTFERQLKHHLTFQASYIGRLGRHLLASRDIMALNNLKDPRSGMDWYTAAGILERLRAQGVSVSAVQQIPYFANLLPSNFAALANANYFCPCGPGDFQIDESLNQTQAVYQVALEFYGNDWTDTQDVIDTGIGGHLFFQPQYGALAALSSIGNSAYHAGTLSIRERLGTRLTLDFNYTLSHSRDDASGLQTQGGYGNAFIENVIRQRDWYADSDFDVRQIINANAIWQLPVGRGHWLFGKADKWVNGFVGGWQVSGIFRWNSGFPAFTPYDDARWATNWNAQSNVVRNQPVTTCPNRGGIDPPKLFGCNTTAAYQSFRNPFPGESGDRNVFRLPGYFALDIGLAKEFKLPWSERQKFQIRWETFNVTNTQHFGPMDTSRTGLGVVLDPSTATPPTNWSNFTGIQGTPRVMQFGFRYSF